MIGIFNNNHPSWFVLAINQMNTFHMKKLFIFFFMFSFLSAWSQENFNTRSHAAIDLSYFPYRSASFFSSELQLKRKKQYLFTGIYSGDYHKQIDTKSRQYAFKIGYGIYPYKNLKRLKVHHWVNYAYEWDTRDKDWRLHYFFWGNGVEYWIVNKFTLGFNLNMGWGHGEVVGNQFQFQPLLTAKYIFWER